MLQYKNFMAMFSWLYPHCPISIFCLMVGCMPVERDSEVAEIGWNLKKITKNIIENNNSYIRPLSCQIL